MPRVLVRILVFIGVLALLNIVFAMFDLHERIDISGSVLITVIVAVIVTVLFGRRG